MCSKLMKLGFLFLTGVLVSFGAAAHAANINTAGSVCHNLNASQVLDIDYLENGVRNLNPAPRPVICPVPRSPLTSGAAPLFFVDGHNNANTSTTCTLFVYTFLGSFIHSFTFTNIGGSSGANWDQAVSFPAGFVGTFDYVSVSCTLPGSGAGIIYGVTSVQ